MNVTISKKKKANNYLIKTPSLESEMRAADRSEKPILVWSLQEDKEIQKEEREQVTFQNRPVLRSRCFCHSRQNSEYFTVNELKEEEQQKSKELIQRRQGRDSKIRVFSCQGKSNLHEQVQPRLLSRLKTMNKSQQRMMTNEFVMKEKLNLLLQTKGCTNTQHTPIKKSRLSIYQKQEGSSLNSVVLSEPNTKKISQSKLIISNNREVNLTPHSLKSSDPPRHNQFVFSHSHKKDSGRQVAFQRDPQLKEKAHQKERQHHTRQQSNQLKIVDPLEEYKSLNTEYLKKKIAFSEVRTDKEVIIDYLYRPIITTEQFDDTEDEPHKNRRSSQFYRSEAIKNITVQNEHQLTEVQMNSEQSFVLAKGLETVFHLPDEIIHKSFVKHGQWSEQNRKTPEISPSLGKKFEEEETWIFLS